MGEVRCSGDNVIAARSSSLPPEQRLAVTYLSAVAVAAEPHEVAHRVAYALGSASAECEPPATASGDPVALSAALVWELSAHRESPAEEARTRVVARFTAARGVEPSQSEEPYLAALLAQNETVAAWHSSWRANPEDPKVLEQLLLAEFTLFGHALSLTHARKMTLAPEAWGTLEAVLGGNVDDAVDTLHRWLVSRAQLEPAVLDAARLVDGGRVETERESWDISVQDSSGSAA
jgi:hypothetical protein